MQRILVSAAAIAMAMAGVAKAQGCEEGIALLDDVLAEQIAAPQAEGGPAGQSGEAAAEQPQFGNPVQQDAERAPSPAQSEPGSVDPQQGDPAATPESGPSGQPGQVARDQPQFGAAARSEAAAVPLAGGQTAPEELAAAFAELTMGERRRLVELRDEAVEQDAVGRDAECLEALRQAEQLLMPEQASEK